MKKSALSAQRQRKDPLGRAVQLQWQALQNGTEADYVVDVLALELEPDVIRAKHFFRDWSQMSAIEQKALQACGQAKTILDVGAAAGCHSLWLQHEGKQVIPIDTSEGAVRVMKERGLQADRWDFFQYPAPEQGFDRILLLMNGLGIAQSVDRLPEFFGRLKELLSPDGVVYMDSSDFQEDAEDFAQIHYRMHFQGHKSARFSWLYLPFDLLQKHANDNGFNASLMYEEEGGAYLVSCSVSP